MRRNYRMEAVQVILCISIFVITVILFTKQAELTILYPIVFGLAAILSIVYALEGIVFNKGRVTKKSRFFLFMLAALVMAAFTYFSAKTVL